MTKIDLANYLQTRRLATLATRNGSGAPQAALLGVAVTPACEVVFDTLATSRKHSNLMRDPRAALVFAGPGEQTVQYEGTAVLVRPGMAADRPYLDTYYAAWPDGRDRAMWPNLVYWRISPCWARFSDYALGPLIAEYHLSDG
jgi:pyridoxine/pyridoxamine 5'-phosphate oxidase